MSDTIYLDYAAATPMDSSVLFAMQPYLTEQFYNPSAQYGDALTVKRAVEDARAQVAHWFGARPSEITFTAGGTEANNLVIHGVMQQYPDAHVVASQVEHDSVINPVSQYDHSLVAVRPDGRVVVEELAKMITDNTVLISIQYANNEVGTIQPIRKITQLVAEVRKSRQKQGSPLPLLVHVDACQAPAYLDIHTSHLGADFVVINASKIYGPKQTAALYCKAGIVLKSQLLGGGQERGLRSGTENVANIVGLATALDLVQARRNDEVNRIQKLQDLFYELLEKTVPAAVINGSKKYRLPNNVHITLPGHDNERLMMQLDNAGIQCAVGSACSASNDEPSHVLKAMGLSDAGAQSSLRFTMGFQTTEEDIRTTVDALAKFIG